MTHAQVGTALPAKLSFARIAAMPAPNVTPALPNNIRDPKNRSLGDNQQHHRTSSHILAGSDGQSNSVVDSKASVGALSAAVAGFSLDPKSDASEHYVSPSRGSGGSLADDNSQLSTSSLKQHSFDTKSMASVTTFAMDEKESIRPDDSASVRAVEEDDVPPGLSRNSSFQQESESHPNLSRTNVRMIGPSVTIAARRYPYTTLANPPRFGDLPVEPILEPVIPASPVNTQSTSSALDEDRPRPAIVNTTPDEKLVEALSSPKDRLPLLQLEEKIMIFMSTSRDSVLELPPQNSFTRLLTHKLADYYSLAHHINDENNSVRIFKTDCRSLPVSLAEIAKSVPMGSQHISHATQVKIMRRVQLGPRQFSTGNSTAASSSVPSKTTSENGVELNHDDGLPSPADGTPNKDRSKLTREEREAQYKAARERIFGDFQESVASESGSTGEASASMSRSSSSSGKKKPRKHKTPKDDTFEARSSFVPSYAPMQMQPTYQQVYNDMQYGGGYHSGNYSPNTFNGMSTNFTVFDSPSSYGHAMGYSTPNGNTYGAIDGWSNQHQTPPGNFYNYQNPPTFQQPAAPQPTNSQYQPSSPSSGLPQPQPWTNQYQGGYTPSSGNSNTPHWQMFGGNTPGVVPYQYGQLPPQNEVSGIPYANQHPVPGSFAGAKSLFNPQTRSFVPGTAPARGGARGGRKKGQGLGSLRTSGASSPAVSSMGESIPMKPKEDSLQQKYGTLANLPKKPPPSQVSPHFSHDHDTVSSGNAPLVVNGSGKSSTS